MVEDISVQTVEQPLTTQQARFALAYCTTALGNAKQAAIQAGYKPGRARKTGWALLRHAGVQAAVAEHLERHAVTKERVLARLAAVAFTADLADWEPFLRGEQSLEELRKGGLDTRLLKRAKVTERTAEGATVTTHREIEMADAVDVLKALAKALGLFVERREVVEDVTVRFAGMSEDELLRRAQVARVLPPALPEASDDGDAEQSDPG